MVKELSDLNLSPYGLGAVLIITISFMTSGNVFGLSSLNSTQSSNVSNAIETPGQGVDRSLIASVINITNHTNPTGAVVQQVINATTAANATQIP